MRIASFMPDAYDLRMNRVAILTLPFLLASQPIWACACCADPGFRAETTFQTEDWIADEISRVLVGKTAHLYQDACGLECVQGISDPHESYDVSLSVSDSLWEMKFSSPNGHSGKLRWTTPDTLIFFRADTSPRAGSGDATLYAEVRMNIEVAGSGNFTQSLMPAELTFTGESNVCLDASRLRHWHLKVRTDDARFHFFGQLAPVQQ